MSQPSQLFSKMFPLIPEFMHRFDLALRGLMVVEHEYILRHGVDLCETQLIFSKLYIVRYVEQILGCLDRNSS